MLSSEPSRKLTQMSEMVTARSACVVVVDEGRRVVPSITFSSACPREPSMGSPVSPAFSTVDHGGSVGSKRHN